MKKIATILGARPQFIKASVVSNLIYKSDVIEETVIHTGQHYDKNMSDVFFTELQMQKPKYSLGIHGGSHAEMTGRMLVAIEKVLMDEKPAAVVVYGDTNTTLAGCLAAVKLHIPVAHIEAGLRSFNMCMPEEINRVLTDRVSRWLFAPTVAACDHLKMEGCDFDRVHEVGDVMYDVALYHGQRVDAIGGVLERLNIKPRSYILVTIHRAENTDDPSRLAIIVDGLEAVAKNFNVVWPIHPRTKQILQRMGREPNLLLIEPVGYLDMVQLEKYATVIATDSGGVQKESFFYNVPCVTLRDETEWVELIESGWNRLAPPLNPDVILDAIMSASGSQGLPINPYGKGDAAEKIVNRLVVDICN